MERLGRAPCTLRLSALTLGAAVVVYALAVGTGAGRDWDASLVAMAVDGGERRTAIAVAHAVNPATAALAVLAVVVLAGRRGGRTAAVATLAIAGGATVTAVVLEWVLGALDVTGGEHARALGPAFFPSGHATVVTALALAVLLATMGNGRRGRAAMAGIAAALLAAPQFLIGWHHPSDILGGVLLAVAWAAAVTHVLPPVGRQPASSGLAPTPARRPQHREHDPARRGLGLLAVLVVAAVVLAEGLPAPVPSVLATLACSATAAWGAVAFAAAIDLPLWPLRSGTAGSLSSGTPGRDVRTTPHSTLAP